jgi:hypothetical protein
VGGGRLDRDDGGYHAIQTPDRSENFLTVTDFGGDSEWLTTLKTAMWELGWTATRIPSTGQREVGF